MSQDVNYVIEGAVSGFAILGDITWPISGNALPISQSGLVLRQCAPNSLTIIDGYPISIESTLVLENVFVFNSITQTGTGVFNALISGISTAASSISGPVVSSAIIGNLIIPYANLGITNSQLDGYVTANKLWAVGCQFVGDSFDIIIMGDQADLQMCIFVDAPNFVFLGSPGILFVDGNTDYEILKETYTLTNGIKSRLDGGLMFFQDSQTINITSDVVLNIYQYSTKYIILTGSLTSNINLTFPLGAWIFTAQDVIFNGHTITFVNSTNSASITSSGLYSLSVTTNSVVISGSSSGSGITATQHQTLRQLIHFVDNGPGDGFASGAFRATTPTSSIFPTAIIWWVDVTQTEKIVEKLIVWSGVVPSQITWNVYNPDGITIAHTIIDNFTYVNNIFEKSRLRTII